MKAFISGVITLSLLTVFITLSGILITRRTDKILSVIDSLPSEISSADPSALSNIWERSQIWFSLTVHREDVDNIDDTIEKLKTHIKTGNETGYLVALTELECLIERLRSTESFSLDRIF